MSVLLNKILKYSDEYDMFPESGTVLVCVSGGADSMCLLEAMLHISYERGFSIAAAHFNHGLRGEESGRDETFVREYCNACGVSLYSGDGDVKAYAKAQNLSIEAAARDLRYDFFFEAAEIASAERIATAHTADDNAETVLLNLARGAGANGLSGIPPVRDIVIRPMLNVSRDEIMSFINERGIPFVEDTTNAQDVFIRNKIRHTVIPVLRELNPRFSESVAATAELLRADDDTLSNLADFFIRDLCAGLTTDAEDLLDLPFAVSSRVIRKLYGRSLSYRHVKAVLELCSSDNPSASISLPGMKVQREYGRIIFSPEQTPSSDGFAHFFPNDGDSVIIFGAGLKMTCKSVVCNDTIAKINKSFTTFLFNSAGICGKIAVRPRSVGDRIRLLGHKETKSLKKLFIERRIPALTRALVPVISDEEGVLAVYGVGIGDRAIPVPGDRAIQIAFEEIQSRE